MIDSVLIANRGEIALRIIRTLKRMGIASVAVFTDSDNDSLHVKAADVAVRLEANGYLDIDAIIDACRRSGAEAIHPGYGFLAENAAFATACATAGLTFIGPPASAIALMGDKINAKRAVAGAGVPVVPGRDEAGLDDDTLAEAALSLGLPILLKPSAGGGGKGMRLVSDATDLAAAISAARREAKGAFGDDTLLVERFITNPRHIEMQVFADSHGHVVSLGERECSLQRRHQKIVEEAPSPLLEESTRQAMAASAVEAARACGYIGAGTVEFIVSADRAEEYFFMEMNTRLQVEHPVTEMVLGGVDLVEWQIRVARGEAIPWTDASTAAVPHGHAVEARVYAEDPARGFLPSTGTIQHLRQARPQRSRVRVDSALFEGMSVGTEYDPMLAKVIGWGETREAALAALEEALSRTTVLGVTTNLAFLQRLLAHPLVRAGKLDTGLVERVAPELLPGPTPDEAIVAAALLHRHLTAPVQVNGDPWTIADSWRVSGPATTETVWITSEGRSVQVAATGDLISIDSGPPAVATGRVETSKMTVDWDGVRRVWRWACDGDTFWLSRAMDCWALVIERHTLDSLGVAIGSGGKVISPMPGTVLEVHVVVGQVVEEGQPVAAVEAMKMEHVVTAPRRGLVSAILVRSGEPVKLDQVLATIEVEDPST